MRTVRGDTLDYDALLIAVGATPDMAIPGALTFSGPRDVGAFAALLADLDAGRVQRVAFAVPASVTWALPLYELALMTGEHVRARGLEGRRARPRHAGAQPARGLRRRASRRTSGACWPSAASRSAPDSVPLRAGPGGLIVAHGEPVQVERIVSLPRLVGPWIGGLPHDGEGFLATDEHGAVARDRSRLGRRGRHRLPAQAGRARRPAGRRGGVRRSPARSAPTCARSPSVPCCAGCCSIPPAPASWTPRAATSRRRRCGGRRRRSPHRTSRSYLAPHAPDARWTLTPEDIDVGELLLGLAERHATLGEDALALRCLNAAAQVRGALPPEAAARRDELAGAHVAG